MSINHLISGIIKVMGEHEMHKWRKEYKQQLQQKPGSLETNPDPLQQ